MSNAWFTSALGASSTWRLLVQAQSWLLPPLSQEAELLTGTGLGTNTQTGLPGPTSKMEKKGNSECSQVSKSQDELFIFKHLSAKKEFLWPSFSLYVQWHRNGHCTLGG